MGSGRRQEQRCVTNSCHSQRGQQRTQDGARGEHQQQTTRHFECALGQDKVICVGGAHRVQWIGHATVYRAERDKPVARPATLEIEANARRRGKEGDDCDDRSPRQAIRQIADRQQR